VSFAPIIIVFFLLVEWKERGSTACGARALELVFTPFALALPSRPQSMGRAAEARILSGHFPALLLTLHHF
jgi:hypothetical protein